MAKSITKTKLQLKAEAIARCKDQVGRIRPSSVVEAARNPNSVLHNEFEWDDKKAAEANRIMRAKELIREVKFEVVYDTVRIAAPFYVSDVTDDEASYVETTKIRKRSAAAKETINDEISRIKAAIHRALALSIVFGLEPQFQEMLKIAVEIESRAGVAEEEA